MNTVAGRLYSLSSGATSVPKLTNPSSKVSATASSPCGVLSNSSRLTTRTLPDASHSTCCRNAAGDTEIGEPEESMEW
jgi:hypothetical protein